LLKKILEANLKDLPQKNTSNRPEANFSETEMSYVTFTKLFFCAADHFEQIPEANDVATNLLKKIPIALHVL
jgi:hypothetical protein